MKTYMQRKEDVARDWYVIDAEGETLGRLATKVASVLRGKHKPTYTPHVDGGDYVIVVNANKVVLTGNKLQDKKYRRHSEYMTGLKEVSYKDLMANNSEKAVMLAVKGMLPHNTLGREMLTKLRVFKGQEHNHEAQKPEIWNF